MWGHGHRQSWEVTLAGEAGLEEASGEGGVHEDF